jgi:hypothetical protein
MLFLQRTHQDIRDGVITATIRRWTRPQAKAGNRYRIADFQIEATALERVPFSEVSIEDARAAGFDSLDALGTELAATTGAPVFPDDEVYVVRFRYAGPLTAPPAVSEERVAESLKKLRGMDERRGEAWTRPLLAIIGERPGVVSTELAKALGAERFALKADVRKLKALGLTNSLLVGYELTDLGRAVLAAEEAAALL